MMIYSSDRQKSHFSGTAFDGLYVIPGAVVRPERRFIEIIGERAFKHICQRVVIPPRRLVEGRHRRFAVYDPERLDIVRTYVMIFESAENKRLRVSGAIPVLLSV